MAQDLALPARKPEDPLKNVKFKWRQSLAEQLALYCECYAEIRHEEISIDELSAMIIENQVAGDRTFQKWLKQKVSASAE